MINTSTKKLIEMHLSAMADAFVLQEGDPSMKDVAFEERFGMLVDAEYTTHKNNCYKRLIKKAELEQPMPALPVLITIQDGNSMALDKAQ